MKSSKDRIQLIVLDKIRSGGGQKVVSTSHQTAESISWEVHTLCSHFCHCDTTLDHHGTPKVHVLLPLREILGLDILIDKVRVPVISHLPEVAPLSIIRRRLRCHSAIVGRVVGCHFSMKSSLLNEFWGSPDLIVLLRENFWDLLTLIEFSSTILEVAFYHVQELIIVLLVHTRILDDQTSKSLQCISHLNHV